MFAGNSLFSSAYFWLIGSCFFQRMSVDPEKAKELLETLKSGLVDEIRKVREEARDNSTKLKGESYQRQQ